VADTFLFRLTGGESSNMSNPNCRVRSNYIKVEVDDLPKNLNVSSNSPVCAGQTLKFSSAEGWAGYEWRGPNGFYDNVSYAQVSDAVLNDSGMYYVEITSFGGCKTIDSTFARIIGTDVDAWPDTSICIGAEVRLNASAGVSYAWSPTENLRGATSPDPLVKPTTTTTFVVKVTDQFGCSDTAHVIVKMKNTREVIADFSSEEYLCLPSDSSLFIDQSAGIIDLWQWTFGNGQQSNVSNPSIQFYSIAPTEEWINAELIVTDTAGCSDTLVKRINIASNCYIAVPTAFTPNGDGLNDFLFPVNAYKATNLKFRVFDRNGHTVFMGSHWSQKWDGKLRGVLQATGVYVWTLDYLDARKQHVFQKGTSVLIR
jgi:gliding motility-associated-like protein